MCDRGTPAPLCTSGALVLVIDDDNDCAPTLHTPALAFDVHENEPPNTKVSRSTRVKFCVKFYQYWIINKTNNKPQNKL